MSYALPPPAESVTKELDFTQKYYHHSPTNSLESFLENVAQVRGFIQENLPRFSHLNERIVFLLGDGANFPLQPITINATTGSPQVTNTIPDPSIPHRTITIMPEYVLDAIEGRMHCQHVFYKRGKPPTLGAIPASFSPAGIPGPCPVFAHRDADALPKPVEDVAQLKRDLREWGYAICKNALSAEQVQILRTAVEEQATAERLAGVGHLDSSHKDERDRPNQRVWNLPNKGDEFLDMLNHPIIDAILPWFLGGNFSLFTMSANIAQPGSSGIYMHRDQMGLTPETTTHPYVLNLIWYLTDVTDKKGATRIYPASHIDNVLPEPMNNVGTSIPAEAPAGSLVLLDSRTWHSTGVNTTQESRPLILQSFCRFYVRQIENYQAILCEQVKAKLSDRQRALLGFPVVNRGGKGQGFSVYNGPDTKVGKMRVAAEKQEKH